MSKVSRHFIIFLKIAFSTRRSQFLVVAFTKQTMKFAALSILLAIHSTLDLVLGESSGKFFYDEQNAWADVPATQGSNECSRTSSSGVGQSPININTADYSCSADSEGYIFYVSMTDKIDRP